MHEKRVEIRWRDVDAYMHVNNAVYATYLEECRDEWVDRALGELGDSWDFVLARVAIDFRRELRPRTRRSCVSCTLERIGNSSVTLSEEIRTREGELSAEAEAVLVARDRELGRSRPLDWRPSARRSRVLSRLGSPLAARAGRAPEPDRLDRPPDDARPRSPPDRRLRRVPRGASARRCRADRARGDRDPPVRPAHVAHSRRLPPGHRRRPTAGLQALCGRTGLCSSSSCSTAAGSRSRRPPRVARPRAIGGAEPPLPGRAAAARVARRSRRSSPASRWGAELAAQGGLDGVEVSAAHRYLSSSSSIPRSTVASDEWGTAAVAARKSCGAVRAAAPGLALGVRLPADSRCRAADSGGAGGRRRRLPLAGPRRVVDLSRLDVIVPPPLLDGS